MKKILIALAVILSVQVAGAQVKSAADSKKAVEAAEAAAQNPKKATKPATWLKVGDTYIDAYTSPYGNAWVGAGKQELTLIMGAEKPSSTETVELMGETFTKEVYPEKNFYFRYNGVKPSKMPITFDRCTIKVNYDGTTVREYLNDSEITSYTASNNLLTSLVYLLKRDNSYTKLKLYGAKITTGGVLSRNFIPCYRISDNKTGLYDLITSEFYPNQATTEFNTGKKIQYGDDLALASEVVSLTGDDTITGTKDFTGTLKTLGEVVPNVKQVANENLLINGDFSVNQRAETSYSGENIYSVDRWKLCDELAVASQNTDGTWAFGVSEATTASSRNIVMQTVEKFSWTKGQKVTASISYSITNEDEAWSTQLFITDGDTTSVSTLPPNQTTFQLTHTVSSNATTLAVGLSTSGAGKNCSITINWFKLEAGEYATMFVPRQPAEELWLCQRYYQNLKLEGQTGTILLPSTFLPVIILNNCMRTTPTMTMVKDPIILGNGVNYTVNASYFSKINYNLVQIALQIYRETAEDPVLPIWDLCVLRNGNMTLDAEIY